MSNVYPHATTVAVIVKKIAKAGKLPADLAPFELGIHDGKTWKSLDATSIPNSKLIKFAVGSPNVGQASAGSRGIDNLYSHNESFKSNTWFEVTDWYSSTSKSLKPFIGYYGYNGLNECALDKYECGKTYSFRVAAYGDIVKRVYHQWRIEEEFSFSTKCCDSCADADCKVVDPKEYYIELIKEINNSKIGRFGVATLVSSCDTAAPSVTVDAKVMELSLCDSGDNAALAEVKAQYPGKDIKRVRRIKNTSTYSVCILDSETMADFVLVGGKYPAQDCADCAPDTTQQESALSGELQCVQADQTKSWVKVGDSKRPTRTLESIFTFDCNTDSSQVEAKAEELFKPNGEFAYQITEYSIEVFECVGKITVTQYGNCMGKDCDSDEVGDDKFPAIPTFLGGQWQDITCSEEGPTDEGCKVGIKFTSYIPKDVADFCGRDHNEFVESNVASFEMYPTMGTEFPEASCDSKPHQFWIAQRGTYRTLSGHQVLKDIILYRKYRGEWIPNPSAEHGSYYQKSEGIVLGVDLSKNYYVVNVTGNYSEVNSLSSSFGDKIENIALYFDDVTVRDEFINLFGQSKLVENNPIRFDI